MPSRDATLDELLDWCASVLGPCAIVRDQSRLHAGRHVGAWRLRTPLGDAYLKTYGDRAHWDRETHFYERWAPALGAAAPRLIAVRDVEPLALVMSALPGVSLEEIELSAPQERAVWRTAGRALADLHAFATGTYYGPCRRDGTCAAHPIADAVEYMGAELDGWVERGLRAGCLDGDERAIVRIAREGVSVFDGEVPVPCHRDYGPANWLVADDGAWVGVIDYEFAHWDVRVADLTRYPNWEWIDRPDLVETLLEGYGRSWTPAEAEQRLVAHALYALSAIVWGAENGYAGFAEEGRCALRHVGVQMA